MLFVIGFHCCFKSLHRAVDLLVDGHVYLCGSSPENHHALHACLFLEVADVLADLLGHVPAVFDILDVVAVKTLCVVVVESGFHGFDGLEFILDRVDVFLFENLRVEGGLVCVGRIDVPCAEYDVV